MCGSQSHLQKVIVPEAMSLEVGSLLSPGILRALCWDPSVALGIETSKTESDNRVGNRENATHFFGKYTFLG